VADLERRDAATAGRLESLSELADRAGAVRARAREIRAALGRLPEELEDLERRRGQAVAAVESTLAELEAAKARLEGLESGRRRRDADVDRARSEVGTARTTHADANAQLERLDAAEARLRSEQTALEREAERLVDEAAAVATGLRAVEGIAEAAQRPPGTSLDELDVWGATARSALFVARGTLETQRERIVVEANALGSAVLGEELGASSVAVVRRRVEAALRARVDG